MALLYRLWPLFAFLAFIVVVKLVLNEYNDAQQDAAKSEVIIEEQGKVIGNAVRANEARKEVLDPTQLHKYCQCVRTSRTVEACERYLPHSATYYYKSPPMCETP